MDSAAAGAAVLLHAVRGICGRLAYVDFFDRWRDKKVPFRLIVLDSKGAARLNMPVTVDSFDVTVRKNGDLEYSIAVTEYRFIK